MLFLTASLLLFFSILLSSCGYDSIAVTKTNSLKKQSVNNPSSLPELPISDYQNVSSEVDDTLENSCTHLFWLAFYQNSPSGDLMKEGDGTLTMARLTAENNTQYEVHQVCISIYEGESLNNDEYRGFIKFYQGEPVGSVMEEGEGLLDYARHVAQNTEALVIQDALIRKLN